jgi:hypothetical protein
MLVADYTYAMRNLFGPHCPHLSIHQATVCVHAPMNLWNLIKIDLKIW